MYAQTVYPWLKGGELPKSKGGGGPKGGKPKGKPKTKPKEEDEDGPKLQVMNGGKA